MSDREALEILKRMLTKGRYRPARERAALEHAIKLLENKE